MLKFIVCEDNPNHLNEITISLNKVMMNYNFDYKIYKFSGYNKELKRLINDSSDQKIYILDVELPEASGLEIASEIRETDWNSIIVFLTAHNEFKDDIFYSRLLALDYIPKNRLSYYRLNDTINVILNKISENQFFTFKYKRNTYRIKYSDILYIEKIPDKRLCLIITESKEEYKIYDTINHIKTELGKEFYKSHKACIVNVTKIKHIDTINNIITFKNGDKTDLLSNRNRKGIKEYVRNY